METERKILIESEEDNSSENLEEILKGGFY